MLDKLKKALGTTTSKWIVRIITAVWVLTVIMAFVALIIWGLDTSFILISVSGVFTGSVVIYMLKSLEENKSKYSSFISEDQKTELIDSVIGAIENVRTDISK